MERIQMQRDKVICFVIMPFSQTTDRHTVDYWNEHFEIFLKPLIEENPKLEARRSKAMRGDILREIITDLVTSRLVVADLTDLNINVFWELGVRQSFKHGTVTIAEEDTRLPVDIDKKGTLFYDTQNHLKMEIFRKDFKEAIQDCLEHSERPDSHVLETLSGRGTLFEIFRRDEAIRRLIALLKECESNIDVLDHCVKCAQKNQKIPDERDFPTVRFRWPAVQLLIIDCYIEEDQAFFDAAERYMKSLIIMNDQLKSWEYKPDSTEVWFLDYVKDIKVREKFIKFKGQIEKSLEKISKRV